MKSLHLGDVAAFLAKAMDAPEPLALSNALELLRNIGALDDQEELTPLGAFACPFQTLNTKICLHVTLLSARPSSLLPRWAAKYARALSA